MTDGDEQSLTLTQDNIDANVQSLSRRQGPHTPPCCRDQQQPQDASPGDNDDNDILKRSSGASHAAGGGAGGRREQPSDRAKISVRKLRWGCEDDMRAVGCCSSGDDGGCRPSWDVVLGSDIAALPYASAYGDLLRTIVSLVSSGKGGGKGGSAAPPSPRKVGLGNAPEKTMNRDKRERGEEAERMRRGGGGGAGGWLCFWRTNGGTSRRRRFLRT